MGRLRSGSKTILVFGIALFATMLAVFLVQETPARLIDHALYDLSVRSGGVDPGSNARSGVVLIVIDDKSRAGIPEPLAYWQPHIATVLRVLQEVKAKSVGLDMIFSAQDMRAMAESKQLAQVVMEANASGMPVILGYDTTKALPTSPLYISASATSPRPLGYLNLPADDDDFVRRFDPCRPDHDDLAFALGVRVAASSLAQEFKCGASLSGGKVEAVLSVQHTLYIPFGRTAAPQKISLVDVLKEAQRNDLAALTQQFAGEMVIIGSDEPQDRHATPLLRSSAGRMPGMEIHATIAQSMYSGMIVREASTRVTWLTVFLFSLLAALAVLVGRWQVSLVFAAGVTLVSLIPALVSWRQGYVISGAEPLLGSILAAGAAFIYRYRTEFLAHRKLRGQFSQYVSPEIVEQIIENGLDLGGSRKKITVLFSDIRGFTTLSEKLPAEALVQQLNEYLSAMTEIVIRNGGYLDKFIGDGILAIYGAPVEQADAAWKATVSATEMLERLNSLNASWKASGRTELKIGIGIHTGEAIVGNMGSSRKLEYTAVGDTVNTASRIESKTKDSIQKFGVHILISGATADELERLGHMTDIAPMESELLKGKSEAIELLMLRGLRGSGRKGIAANA